LRLSNDDEKFFGMGFVALPDGERVLISQRDAIHEDGEHCGRKRSLPRRLQHGERIKLAIIDPTPGKMKGGTWQPVSGWVGATF
jgi:hypothetical protein